MSQTPTFRPATKSTAKLRAALFGPSGAGKTMTALRIATGLGGPIAVIDTERGSASKYADRFAFDVLELPRATIPDYQSAIAARPRRVIRCWSSTTSLPHGGSAPSWRVPRSTGAHHGGQDPNPPRPPTPCQPRGWRSPRTPSPSWPRLNTWKVLTESIFPSAKTAEGILLAVRYCQARGLDVLKRPVHVVPMWLEDPGREVETDLAWHQRGADHRGAHWPVRRHRPGTLRPRRSPASSPVVPRPKAAGTTSRSR